MNYFQESAHWSAEAEAGVIGGLLATNGEAFDDVASLLTSADFASSLYARAFDAVMALSSAGKAADIIGVYEAVKDSDDSDQTLSQLHDCLSFYVGKRVLVQHAQIVREKSVGRAFQRAATEITGIAADESIAVLERIGQAQSLLEGVEKPQDERAPTLIADHVVDLIDRIQDRHDGVSMPGIPTMIPSLDRLLVGGLRPGKQVIIAARPSVGKSSLAQQLCLNVAEQGHAAAFFSMEMGPDELTERATANLGRVALDHIMSGKLEEDEWTRLSEAVERMRLLPFIMHEQSAMTLHDIAGRARRLKRQHDIKLLVIDYIQLCSSGKASSSRHHQLEEISRGLKSLAVSLGITIITLSQLNRDIEKRTNGRPVMSDLKESGAIEEDADIVMMLWPFAEQVLGCAVAKNRQGMKGDVALHLEGKYQRWTESTMSLAAPTKPMGGARSSRFDPDF